MKIKPLVVLAIILISACPASAWEIDEKYSGGAFSTQSGTYVLAKTLTHTVDSDSSLQVFQVQYSVYTTSSTNNRAHYVKVTAQVSGGPETTISEAVHSDDDIPTPITRNVNFEAAKGQTVTVRFYLHRDGSYYPAYWSLIKDVYSRAYVIEYPPEITATTTIPDNSYANTLSYSISGVGVPSATLYIDNNSVWSGGASWGTNYISLSGLGITQGSHTWYVNASSTQIGQYAYSETPLQTFIYDSINPAVIHSVVSPDVDNVAVGNTVSVSAQWYDANIDYVQWWVNTGTGYTLIDTTTAATLAGNNNWCNKSIDTAGKLGKTINWKQVAYDKAGNSYTLSDSFFVILDAVQIYTYDETTGTAILPTSIRFYNDQLSRSATIDPVTKVGTVSYTGLKTHEKYVVTVTADDYYTRTAIVEVNLDTLSRLDVYLINESENVIYEKFTIGSTYQKYDNSEYIIKLDKPVNDETVTVFQSYFDFNGLASSYLITNDAYILYIISPETTYSYGWLTPDADGEIAINLNRFTFDSIENWINYTYTETNESISFLYQSNETVSEAKLTVTNEGGELYNSTITTDSGSFTYLIPGDGIYQVSISVNTTEGLGWVYRSVLQVGNGASVDPFPESYTLAVKSVIVAFFIVLGVLALSSYRADLSCIYAASLYGFAVYQEWCIGNIYTVSILGIIAVAAIVKFQKKHDRSVN